MKKGQVTIFVIIGLVLIIVLIFALTAGKKIEKLKNQNQAQNILDSSLKDGVLNNYVSGCLERVAENGMKQILLQGGRLYNTPEQRGPIDTSNFKEGKDYLSFNYSNQTLNVTYAIFPNDRCDKVILNPPFYPTPNMYLLTQNMNEGVCLFEFGGGDGYYGINNLSRLCERNGPNIIETELSNIGITCPPKHVEIYEEQPIQSQLEVYIEKHLPNCINFTVFNELYGDVTVMNKPEVIFTYGHDTVSVDAKFPFFVDVENNKIARFHTFHTDIKTNIKGLYACAFNLVSYDVKNISFNKLSDFDDVPGCKNYIYSEYRGVSNYSDALFDDIISIRDPNSLIDGEQLTFLFAIMNRRPALDWIHDPTIPASSSVDIWLMENETIIFSPQAYDPDDLKVWYNYSLWQENFIDEFNYSCCLSGGGDVDCTVNYDQCMIKNYSIAPKAWSNSERFLLTEQYASYQTLHSDVGFHTVNITTWDREGLVDYQEVTILVFDRPEAKLNGSNPYSDIGNGFASREDPYLLSGNLSKVSTILGGLEVGNYYWNDTLEFYFNTTESELHLPNQNYSINTSNPDNITKKNFSMLGVHNISLTVSQNTTFGMVYSNPYYINVTVLQCLPHRANSYSWPYNLVEWDGRVPELDAFQANHTCCYLDEDEDIAVGTIKQSGVCFDYDSYGYIGAFKLITDELHIPVASPDPYAEGNYRFMNDIYKRTFERSCSGNSGNTCDGLLTSDIENYLVCDETGNEGNLETCVGPSKNEEVENISDIGCVDYGPGDSFEKSFGLTKIGAGNQVAANGSCSDELKCASGEGSAGGTFNSVQSNHFKCAAKCDGGGCNYPIECVCAFEGDGADGNGDVCAYGGVTSSNCENKKPGDTLGNLGNAGCDTTCNFVPCSEYLFNQNTMSCYGRGSGQCTQGYSYDTDTGRCVSGANGQETGGDYDNVNSCEELFGAKPQCDEQQPGECIGVTGYKCDLGCQYIQDIVCP